MKVEKTEAIVLQTYPSRERDKLVVFITPELGKRKGWAYGARSMRTRFGASLEPLAKIRIGFIERENEEVVRIESVDLLRSLFPAQQKLGSSIAATYMAETVDTFAQPSDPSELIYRLLDSCLEALNSDVPPLIVTAYFEIWILRVAGLLPSVKHCAVCQGPLKLPLRFEPANGGFVCESCSGRSGTVLPNDVTEHLLSLLRLPAVQFAALAPTAEQLFDIRSVAREVRRAFLGHELRSHDLLQAVLAEG